MSVNEPAAPPARSNAKVVATIIVVIAFIAGLLVGAVGDRIWAFRHPRGPHGPFAANRIVERLSRELDLTPQQKAQVSAIVAAHGKKMDAVWSAIRPQIRAEIDAANREISAVLTPDQREKFDKLRMRLGPRRGPGGPPPGPPPE